MVLARYRRPTAGVGTSVGPTQGEFLCLLWATRSPPQKAPFLPECAPFSSLLSVYSQLQLAQEHHHLNVVHVMTPASSAPTSRLKLLRKTI